jgi:hypothetical protein
LPVLLKHLRNEVKLMFVQVMFIVSLDYRL